MSDAEILEQVLAGHTDLYGEIFSRHKDRAFGLAFQYVRNREEAKDVVQEAFVKAFQNLNKFKLDRNFAAWFLTIVRNLAIDFLRKRKRITPDGLPAVLPDTRNKGRAEKRLVARELWAAMDKLSDPQREIIFLKDYLGHSYREIAEIVDIPLGTVMSRLHHARKKLISILKKRES